MYSRYRMGYATLLAVGSVLNRVLHVLAPSSVLATESPNLVDEAIQLAVRIRVILHPGGKKSKSLLQHLNSGRIPLLTTSEDVREFPGLIQHDGLTSFRRSLICFSGVLMYLVQL